MTISSPREPADDQGTSRDECKLPTQALEQLVLRVYQHHVDLGLTGP